MMSLVRRVASRLIAVVFAVLAVVLTIVLLPFALVAGWIRAAWRQRDSRSSMDQDSAGF